MNALAAELEVTVETGDARNFPADVLALKYARRFYGADSAVATQLARGGIQVDDLRPTVGSHRFVDTRGLVTAAQVLVVAVPLSPKSHTETSIALPAG
jgi:hypothetical protein